MRIRGFDRGRRHAKGAQSPPIVADRKLDQRHKMRTGGTSFDEPPARLYRFKERNGLYSSSPSSSSPTLEGATPPNIGGTSFGGSAFGVPAELARRFGAAG